MKRIIFVFVTSMCVMGQAFGAMLEAGTSQISATGNITDTTGINVTLGMSSGYFVMDNFEIGTVGDVASLDDGDVSRWGVGAYGEYNFAISEKVVPFVGLAVGYEYVSIDTVFVDESDSAFEIVGYVGTKYYIVENLAIGTAVRFMAASEDVYVGDGEMEATDWDIVLRTSFYF